MPLLEISIIPVGTQTSSMSSTVTEAVRLLEDRGVSYQVTPTATVIEGDIDMLMDVAKAIHQQALANGSNRVVTHINIDDRQDRPLQLNQQVEIVEQSLQ